MKKNAMRVMTIVVSMFVGMNVLAVTTWTGAVDDNWSTAGNWTGDVGGVDPDVQINEVDPEGVVNVNTTPTLDRIVLTNVVTGFSFSGNTLSFAPAANPANTITDWTIIGSVSNALEHTFNNNIDVPVDGTVNRILLNSGEGSFVFNGAVSINNSEDNQLELRGNVTLNNGITASALRFANSTVIISNPVDNVIDQVVTVNSAANAIINTPAGINFHSGQKFQHNSSAVLTFNNANVIGDSTGIVGGGSGKTIEYRFNGDEDLGWLQVGGNQFNLVLGESVNTLAFDDSSGRSWSGGSVNITGFRTNAISFGSDSGGLTDVQLLTITADGQTGGAQLDENGFLFFAGEPPLVTGEMIVDYEGGSNTNARPADIESDTGYTWNFSETEPLLNDPSGQNRTIYGGVISTWTVSTNYMPELVLTNGQIWAKVNPANGSDTTLKGMYVWSKEDFLLGSDGTLSFTNGNAMALGVQFAWGQAPSRLVVKQGGTYYVSDAVNTGSGTLLIDPADPNVSWAVVSTNDYSTGSYGPMTFSDIEAVGIHFDFSRTANGIFLTYNDLFARANVVLPPLTEISDVSVGLINGGSQIVLSWQGTNAATYALQMRNDLVFGDWSNIVENISGLDDIMSVTNATDEPQAFFRTILE